MHAHMHISELPTAVDHVHRASVTSRASKTTKASGRTASMAGCGRSWLLAVLLLAAVAAAAAQNQPTQQGQQTPAPTLQPQACSVDQ